jgi:hypothetical protein
MIHPGDKRIDLLRGIFHVSVRAFENLELGVLLSSTQPASYSGRLLGASEGENPVSAADLEGLAESRIEGPRCVRGIITGIGMEVLMAFCIYGAWHLIRGLHLFR